MRLPEPEAVGGESRIARIFFCFLLLLHIKQNNKDVLTEPDIPKGQLLVDEKIIVCIFYM